MLPAACDSDGDGQHPKVRTTLAFGAENLHKCCNFQALTPSHMVQCFAFPGRNQKLPKCPSHLQGPWCLEWTAWLVPLCCALCRSSPPASPYTAPWWSSARLGIHPRPVCHHYRLSTLHHWHLWHTWSHKSGRHYSGACGAKAVCTGGERRFYSYIWTKCTVVCTMLEATSANRKQKQEAWNLIFIKQVVFGIFYLMLMPISLLLSLFTDQAHWPRNWWCHLQLMSPWLKQVQCPPRGKNWLRRRPND